MPFPGIYFDSLLTVIFAIYLSFIKFFLYIYLDRGLYPVYIFNLVYLFTYLSDRSF